MEKGMSKKFNYGEYKCSDCGNTYTRIPNRERSERIIEEGWHPVCDDCITKPIATGWCNLCGLKGCKCSEYSEDDHKKYLQEMKAASTRIN